LKPFTWSVGIHSPGNGNTIVKPVHLPENPRTSDYPAINFKNSVRWYESTDPVRSYDLPYINQLGMLTPYTLYKWKTFPSKVLASIVSTVYHRLFAIVARKNGQRYAIRNSELMLRGAACYILSKNEYLYRRLLGMLMSKQSHQAIVKFVYFLTNKIGANTRFVLGQVCLQATWLKSRVERPRAKPDSRMYSDLYDKSKAPYTFASAPRVIHRLVKRTVLWYCSEPLNDGKINSWTPPRRVIQ